MNSKHKAAISTNKSESTDRDPIYLDTEEGIRLSQKFENLSRQIISNKLNEPVNRQKKVESAYKMSALIDKRSESLI